MFGGVEADEPFVDRELRPVPVDDRPAAFPSDSPSQLNRLCFERASQAAILHRGTSACLRAPHLFAHAQETPRADLHGSCSS